MSNLDQVIDANCVRQISLSIQMTFAPRQGNPIWIMEALSGASGKASLAAALKAILAGATNTREGRCKACKACRVTADLIMLRKRQIIVVVSVFRRLLEDVH
jgi:hypothetical protein